MLERVLDDYELWRALRLAVVRRVRPMFREAFLIGAALGARERPTGAKAGLDALGGVMLALSPEVMLARLSGVKADIPGLDAAGMPLPDSSGLVPLPFDFDEIARAADDVIDAYTDEWWETVEVGTRERMRAVLRRATNDGLTMPQIIREMEPLFGEARAARIAVAETTNLMGMGAQETYRRAGFGAWIWRTARDTLVDPVCEELSLQSDPKRGGRPFPMTRRFQRAHIGCVLPGTLLSGATVEAATARRFDGEVIVIRTASGHELSVTANHPILTPTGWVAAGMLHEGDEIVSDARAVGIAPLVDPDDQEVPASAEQVAGALLRAGAVRRAVMPTAAEDFHGDGAIDGDVDVVWPLGALGHAAEAAGNEIGQQPGLVATDVRSRRVRLSGGGSALVLDGGGRSALGGIVGRRDLGRALGLGHPGPLHRLGLPLSASPYALLDQSSLDGVPPDAVVLGEGEDGVAADVALGDLLGGEGVAVVCRVRSLRRVAYSGHVYNLQTATGYYTADGIVVQNCRCWPVPAGPPSVQRVLAVNPPIPQGFRPG